MRSRRFMKATNIRRRRSCSPPRGSAASAKRARSSIAARRSTPRTERARPRSREPRKRARLHLAALLIDRGADVNARAIDGSTPLFYAAEADRAAMTAPAARSRRRSQHPRTSGLTAARRRRLQRFGGERRTLAQARRGPQRARRRRQERDGLRRRPRQRADRRRYSIDGGRRRQPASTGTSSQR